MKPIIVLLAVLVLTLTACARTGDGGGEAGEGGAAGATVDIDGFAFVPDELVVAAGATVTWTNRDGVAHTVTAEDEVFDSGLVDKEGTFELTFDEAGTYSYFCQIHPSMTGVIIVE